MAVRIASYSQSLANWIRHHDEILINVMVAVGIVLATILLMKRILHSRTKQISGKPNKNNPNDASIGQRSSPIQSIWDFNRKQQASFVTSNLKNSGSSGKPFGSTYYYAHNNPNATGGYKDGLTMEDYVMNQPRLLSRDGKPVVGTETVSTAMDHSSPSATSSVAGRTVSEPPGSTVTKKDPDVKLITKYQWDDPGDAQGIAHIRIDTLPGQGDRDIRWQDVNVKDVSVKLVGKGLLVRVTTERANVELTTTTTIPTIYELNIPQLYGQAGAVRAFVKPKRLMVRIWKSKRSFLLSHKENTNLKPWPQLRKL